tara:strand:- start:509 stop:721 length:213 start_codon:yes stop_codon:yes gene_type:complete
MLNTELELANLANDLMCLYEAEDLYTTADFNRYHAMIMDEVKALESLMTKITCLDLRWLPDNNKSIVRVL